MTACVDPPICPASLSGNSPQYREDNKMAGHILKIAAVLIMLTVLPATPAVAQLVDSFISKNFSASVQIDHFDGECRLYHASVFFGESFGKGHGEKKTSDGPAGAVFIEVFNFCTGSAEILIERGNFFPLSHDEFTLHKHGATLNTTVTVFNSVTNRLTNVVLDIEWVPTGSFSRFRGTNRNVGFGFVTTEKFDGFTVPAIARGSLIAEGINFLDLVGADEPFAQIGQGGSHRTVKIDKRIVER
jgi:hypothetical protein